MRTNLQPHPQLDGVFLLEVEQAERINPALITQFHKARDADDSRQTHHFHGRFENTYVQRSRVPALQAVLDTAHSHAGNLLGHTDLKSGFWFNEMGPGHRTSLHSHEESDELLSAVYYIAVPADSGDLILHGDEGIVRIQPRPGLMVLFDPSLPHEVTTNESTSTRLSVAMNFGPAQDSGAD